MKKLVYILFLMLTLIPIGCATDTPPNPNPAKADIAGAKKNVASASETLTKTTKDIAENANQIDKKVSPDNKPAITPHTAAILQDTAIQGEVLKQLEEAKKLLESATTKSEQFEKLYNAEVVKRKAAEDSATKHLKDLYTLVSVVCFGGAIVCLILFATGQKWAMLVGLGCGAGCVAALFVVQTLSLIPWIVGGILLLVATVLVWQFIAKNRRINDTEQQVKTLDTAATELVKTVEAQKPLMTQESRKSFFGDGPIPGVIVNHLQSEETQKIVKAKRAGITQATSIPSTISA